MRHPQHENHGAQLVQNKKMYLLRNKDGCVQATIFKSCDKTDFPKLEKAGWTVSAYRQPKAWRDIPLSQVPASQAENWEVWDEY